MDLNEHYGEVQPSFGWVQRPFVQADGHWKSGVVGISPHNGDWHHAADKMRLWLAPWWKAPSLPASLRGAIGFQNVYFREFTGREIHPISSLPGLARHGLEHSLHHIVVWDMPLLGMYLSAARETCSRIIPSGLLNSSKLCKRCATWGSMSAL
jgi:hypothetical protein